MVLSALRALGSSSPTIRAGTLDKAGPLKTDQDNFIVDAPFPTLLTAQDLSSSQVGRGEGGVWEVETLARELKLIEGVLSVGIFCGRNGEELLKAGKNAGGQKPVAAYFGMQDGSVVVRRAGEERKAV